MSKPSQLSRPVPRFVREPGGRACLPRALAPRTRGGHRIAATTTFAGLRKTGARMSRPEPDPSRALPCRPTGCARPLACRRRRPAAIVQGAARRITARVSCRGERARAISGFRTLPSAAAAAVPESRRIGAANRIADIRGQGFDFRRFPTGSRTAGMVPPATRARAPRLQCPQQNPGHSGNDIRSLDTQIVGLRVWRSAGPDLLTLLASPLWLISTRLVARRRRSNRLYSFCPDETKGIR